MATITSCALAAAAAFVFTACGGKAPATNDNATTAAPAPPAAPTTDALVPLEKSSYEAWKSKDVKFWVTHLSDRFVGYGWAGRLDKASATEEYAGIGCEIKGYVLSDEQVRPLSNEAALLTYKAAVDGACGGQIVPPSSWAATVYVRDGAAWKEAFHAEAAIVDPKVGPAKPVDQKAGPKEPRSQPAGRDAGTDAMLAVEKAVWEAWRLHEPKKLEDLTARDISFINIFGTYFGTKAEALKDWTGIGCDVKSVGVTDALGTMLSPTVGILTFRGAADGTCYGQKVGPIWGTSIYVKEGDVWRWTFGINVPATGQGA